MTRGYGWSTVRGIMRTRLMGVRIERLVAGAFVLWLADRLIGLVR